MNKHAFIFIGRSGSGKGTQVEFLKKKLGEKFPEQEINTLFIGDQLRTVAHGGNYTAELAQELLDKGKLFPDILSVWATGDEFINKMKKDQTLIIDGFPRSLSQSAVMDSAMRFYDYTSLFIIHLDISAEESGKRLLERNRGDDTSEAIEKREEWFAKRTIPAIDYFKDKVGYTVLNINGEQDRENVSSDIWKGVEID